MFYFPINVGLLIIIPIDSYFSGRGGPGPPTSHRVATLLCLDRPSKQNHQGTAGGSDKCDNRRMAAFFEPRISCKTYWCLAGNEWELGNEIMRLFIINSYYGGSFPPAKHQKMLLYHRHLLQRVCGRRWNNLDLC